MSIPSSNWSSVTVYGVEHSPWLQGIYLALTHHNISIRLTSYPLSWSWFWHHGLVFPVLLLPDKTTIRDSFAMYKVLESNGYALGLSQFSDEDILQTQVELELLFTAYVMGRCMPGKNWAFIRAWSQMREQPNSLWGTAWRGFITHYFWLLIRMGIRKQHQAKRDPYDLERVAHHLQSWDEKLSTQSWLTGDAMGAFDFALFGHLQCMATGLTDEVLPLIQQQTHLMAWMNRMMQEMPDVSPMYTPRITNPNATVPTASIPQQLVFWTAWLGSLMFWPLTLPLVILALQNRFRNPARSGRLAQKHARRSSH